MRFLRFAKGFTVFLVLVSLLAMASCAKGPRSVRNSKEFIREYNLRALPRFDIPIEVNDRVVAWIQYFQGAGRKSFQKYLERSGRYRELIGQILLEEKVPQDLIYISMIESGFSPHAYSRAHAVGLWQFIKATGRRYGLQVDGWEDDRRDPHKATRAAARHFRDLYNEHGDWYLAMVGYNAGPGRIKKAIKMTGSRDFWDMARHRRALRAETRDYVPKFIAAAIMSKMPERFGFTNIEYAKPYEYEIAVVETQTDLQVIAECAGVDQEEVKILNAHLYRGATPPVKNYEIRLPKGTKDKFNVAYAKVPKEKRIRIVYYRVKGGDTLSKIARKYGVSVKAIASANGIRNYRKLRKGQNLTIPLHGYSAQKYASESKSRDSSRGVSGKSLFYHEVKPGETTGGIAEKYGMRVSDIKKWNGLNKRLTIRAGQKLKIYKKIEMASSASSPTKKVTRSSVDIKHKLRRGETLGHVADKYGVSTKELMAWNGIDDPRRVRAGSMILVKGEKVPLERTTAVKLGSVDTPRSEPLPVRASAPSGSTVHILKSGETLGHVAQKYGVSSKDIMAWNGIKDPKRVRSGTKLNIRGLASEPVEVERTSEPAKVSSSTAGTGDFYTYSVKSGETLGGIANRHGVSIRDLKSWNNIKNPRSVRAGSKLRIMKSENTAKTSKKGTTSSTLPSPAAPINISSAVDKEVAASPSASMVYNVRSGDTLWDIARKHRVTIAQLQKWNDLNDPSSVRPGTKLTIQKN